jgi:endoglycosylceramidase
MSLGNAMSVITSLVPLVLLSASVVQSTERNGKVALPLSDEQGRHFIPRGFVTVTEDVVGPVQYRRGDYLRMVRCGANFQVIRLKLGRLGGWPGARLDKDYLQQVDVMVRLGREAGLKTAFKMTVYGTPGFGGHEGWTRLWLNKNHEHDHIIGAWRAIWQRYRDDPSVFGYDLLNEPFRGTLAEDYRQITQTRLIPLYRRLIDELHKISSEKWAIYQPLLLDINDRGPDKLPMVEMTMSVDRRRLIFSPHGYFPNAELHAKAVERHLREAALSAAGLMMGEWGRQTYKGMDDDLVKQADYRRLYAEVAAVFDGHGMGMVKAWFTGTRGWNGKKRNYTWSVFRDTAAVGTVERKYIMDLIARPAPLVVAGRIRHFGFEPATRTFQMTFTADRKQAASEIFVGENRHYPDGFTVVFNDTLQLAHDPLEPEAWCVLQAPAHTDTSAFRFDARTQRLRVTCWPGVQEKCTLTIIPGTTGSCPPAKP